MKKFLHLEKNRRGEIKIPTETKILLKSNRLHQIANAPLYSGAFFIYTRIEDQRIAESCFQNLGGKIEK